MESRIYKKCTICGVRRLPESRLFLAKFPLDPDRCRLWVKASGIEDLVSVPIEKLHQLKFICGAHFARHCFNTKGNRLLASAVPTKGLMRTPLSDDLFTEFPLHVKSYYDKINPAGKHTGTPVLTNVHKTNGTDNFVPTPSTSKTPTHLTYKRKKGGPAKLCSYKMSGERELRIVTYMCPTHPVELYELIMEVLEQSVGIQATLQYESRSSGPLNGRPDPFETDKVDLGFMTAAAYMNLRDKNKEHMELLPVTPVFAHQMNVENKPGYFSDIIIHSDKKAHNVNTLLDLRGCTYAYSNEESLSGSKIVLKTLKEKGENASFFGSVLKSGSHLASAQMVLTKRAEWAAVDATTLLYSKKFMQDGGRDITTLETLGRLPPYPVVVNSRLSDELKNSITKVLLTLPHTKWKNEFAKYGIIKFDANNDAAYNGPSAQMWSIQSEKLNIRYY